MAIEQDSTNEASPQIAEGVPEDIAQKYRALAQERGYHFGSFEWLGERDPEFERARLALVDMTYTRADGDIPKIYRELIACGVLAFRTYPSLKKHLARALREGATVEQVVQAMQIASIPGGMATLHFALDELVKLEQEQPELFKRDD